MKNWKNSSLILYAKEYLRGIAVDTRHPEVLDFLDDLDKEVSKELKQQKEDILKELIKDIEDSSNYGLYSDYADILIDDLNNKINSLDEKD